MVLSLNEIKNLLIDLDRKKTDYLIKQIPKKFFRNPERNKLDVNHELRKRAIREHTNHNKASNEYIKELKNMKR